MLSDCDTMAHGVQHRALFHIDPRFVIPDVLHMKLRVVGRLVYNLLLEFEDFDVSAQVLNPSIPKEEYMDGFVELVRSCAAKFSLWKDENTWCFTSLTGDDADLLLQKLPEKLKGELYSDTETTVTETWTTLRSLLDPFTSNATDSSAENQACLEFLQRFIDLGKGPRRDYGKRRVTPYIHILCHHAAQKHEEFKSLGWFSSQSLEKKKMTSSNTSTTREQTNGTLLPTS
ncbi:hypothetical protein HPB48_003322 [Haemaphysalis longicornis]|uniref:Uncharacterized protein n=1 Tax=Haemaphysalis longicornis TaxID=44386 RepID=A0A9J6GA28_HAELO|nr:hypothetical protein HPB48_003322 [Haemaphysalis longicornis]